MSPTDALLAWIATQAPTIQEDLAAQLLMLLRHEPLWECWGENVVATLTREVRGDGSRSDHDERGVVVSLVGMVDYVMTTMGSPEAWQGRVEHGPGGPKPGWEKRLDLRGRWWLAALQDWREFRVRDFSWEAIERWGVPDGRVKAENQEHRLYSAAYVLSDPPTLAIVHKRLGLVTDAGEPNDRFWVFTGEAHYEWARREQEWVRENIVTTGLARAYLDRRAPWIAALLSRSNGVPTIQPDLP